jgi:hypothetical protein
MGDAHAKKVRQLFGCVVVDYTRCAGGRQGVAALRSPD